MPLRTYLLSLLACASGCFDLPPGPPALLDVQTADAAPAADSEDTQADASDAFPDGDTDTPSSISESLPGLWLVGYEPVFFDWYRFGPQESGTGVVVAACPAGPTLKSFLGPKCDDLGSWEVLGPQRARVLSPCLKHELTWDFSTDNGELLGGALERWALVTSDPTLESLIALRFPSDYCDAELTNCVDPF